MSPSARTRIEYVTEGILLASDARRSFVGWHCRDSLFDEFHERHLYGDITLARALGIQETIASRSPTGRHVRHVGDQPFGKIPRAVPKRSFRADARFPSRPNTSPVPRPSTASPAWELAAEELARLATAHPDGDALVFMPGAYEISRTLNEIRNHPRLGQLARAAAPRRTPPRRTGRRRGALIPAGGRSSSAPTSPRPRSPSTACASSSTPASRASRVSIPYRGINTLLVEKISRASADQRAGRAGRTAPGHCLRLWTEAEHADRPAQETPEVRRLDLAEVVLTLKASGVDDDGFIPSAGWNRPNAARSTVPTLLLRDLGALDRATGSDQRRRAADARVSGPSALRPDAARRP